MKFGSKAFFMYYEAAHQNAANRYIHHVSHCVAVIGAVSLPFNMLLCLGLILLAFGISWTGHYVFEKNTPAFFETNELNGANESIAHHIKVAIGGVVWTIACFMRLFGVGPLVDPQ